MEVSAWQNDRDEDDQHSSRGLHESALKSAETGEIENLIKLLIVNPSLIDFKDRDGYTPLHRACYGNQVTVVKYLLQKKAAINVETHDGWQPLHSASFWNNTECMVLLIQYGADINAMSRGQQSPLHLVSASSHNSPGLQLLLLHPDTNSHQENSSGDTAKNVAQRTGKYYALFEIIYPCLNNI